MCVPACASPRCVFLVLGDGRLHGEDDAVQLAQVAEEHAHVAEGLLAEQAAQRGAALGADQGAGPHAGGAGVVQVQVRLCVGRPAVIGQQVAAHVTGQVVLVLEATATGGARVERQADGRGGL